jgi:hypothetical protein
MERSGNPFALPGAVGAKEVNRLVSWPSSQDEPTSRTIRIVVVV